VSLGGTAFYREPCVRTAWARDVRVPAYQMAGAVALAWLGMYIHNVADLPNLTVGSPENTLPGLLWLAAFGVWVALPGRSWPAAPLLAWSALNLVGGFASVLPLPVLPFRPEQSVRHYAFHVLYALAQLPVGILARVEFKRGHHRSQGAA
jgi:hypothetical protein